MNLVKTSFLSAISTTVNLLSRLVTNKIIAVYLGAQGMFLLGQLKDFISIGVIAGNLGSNNGIIKYTAEYQDEHQKLNEFLNSGLKIHLYFSTVVCILTFLFRDAISNYFFKDLQFSPTLILLSFSFITVTLNNFFIAVFNGLKLIKVYLTVNVISAVISALIMIVLAIKLNIIGAFYAIAINQIAVFIITLSFIKKLPFFNIIYSSLKIDSTHFKNLTKFSLMAIIAPVCLVGATLFVRFYLNNKLGSNFAGSWEGMWRLSGIYMMFITTTFQFYLLPTFSAISNDNLKKEIFNVWNFSLPAIIFVTGVVYIFKDFIIQLIFTDEFLLINSIILFHLLGDILKINTWVLGNVLISQAKTKIFIFFQVLWAVTFSVLVIVFVNKYGFVGVSYAYFLTYVIHFLSMNFYFRKLIWIR